MQPGHWTLGVLETMWSIAGDGGRPDVNQLLLQYFINYNLKKGWFITWQPTLTANWEATNGNTWTVPFGGGLGENHENWEPTGFSHGTILWKRGTSRRDACLDNAAADSVLISQA